MGVVFARCELVCERYSGLIHLISLLLPALGAA